MRPLHPVADRPSRVLRIVLHRCVIGFFGVWMIVGMVAESDARSGREEAASFEARIDAAIPRAVAILLERSENYGTAMTLLALLQPRLPSPARWAVTEGNAAKGGGDGG